MTLAIVVGDRDGAALADLIKQRAPEIPLHVGADVPNPDRVLMAGVWSRHPQDLWTQWPNLRAVASLGAGVDFLLNDSSLPPNVHIVKVVSDQLAAEMARLVACHVLQFDLELKIYQQFQHAKIWNPQPHRAPGVVGFLGMGQMAQPAARALLQLGYRVLAWTRSGDVPEGVTSFRGDKGLDDLAAQVDVLVNLLPLTPETTNILAAPLFKQMKSSAMLINAGRGGHLVDNDLLDALEKGKLKRAALDVFREEPLPPSHPFWSREAIIMTPHVAARTAPEVIAAQWTDAYRAVIKGRAPQNRVDRQRGY